MGYIGDLDFIIKKLSPSG